MSRRAPRRRQAPPDASSANEDTPVTDRDTSVVHKLSSAPIVYFGNRQDVDAYADLPIAVRVDDASAITEDDVVTFDSDLVMFNTGASSRHFVWVTPSEAALHIHHKDMYGSEQQPTMTFSIIKPLSNEGSDTTLALKDQQKYALSFLGRNSRSISGVKAEGAPGPVLYVYKDKTPTFRYSGKALSSNSEIAYSVAPDDSRPSELKRKSVFDTYTNLKRNAADNGVVNAQLKPEARRWIDASIRGRCARWWMRLTFEDGDSVSDQMALGAFMNGLGRPLGLGTPTRYGVAPGDLGPEYRTALQMMAHLAPVTSKKQRSSDANKRAFETYRSAMVHMAPQVVASYERMANLAASYGRDGFHTHDVASSGSVWTKHTVSDDTDKLADATATVSFQLPRPKSPYLLGHQLKKKGLAPKPDNKVSMYAFASTKAARYWRPSDADVKIETDVDTLRGAIQKKAAWRLYREVCSIINAHATSQTKVAYKSIAGNDPQNIVQSMDDGGVASLKYCIDGSRLRRWYKPFEKKLRRSMDSVYEKASPKMDKAGSPPDPQSMDVDEDVEDMNGPMASPRQAPSIQDEASQDQPRQSSRELTRRVANTSFVPM